MTTQERIERRAAALEREVRGAAAEVDLTRKTFGHAIDNSHRIERSIMEADIAGKPTHGLTADFMDSRREIRQAREALREAADKLTERRRAWAVFASAACEMAGKGQAGGLDAHLL